MAYNLLPCDREQDYFMPPSLREWLGEGHLVWFVIDAVGQMDLSEFYAAYRSDGWGAAAYEPSMMVALLLYAYCRGIRSSRKIARALEEDVGFRVVAANQQPDFRTICRFRAEHEKALERLFVQVLRLCREAGLVKLGVVALDGTKVAANAALAANRGYEAIREEVRRILAEARAVDAEEDGLFGPEHRGDELPQGLGRRAERLERLEEAKARLEQEVAEEAKTAGEHLAQRREDEASSGKKKRGRKPKVTLSIPDGEAKANTSDPDSRIMKTRQGYVQGYNVQTVVSQDQVIVAVGVTREANDVQQLKPMLETLERTLEAAGIEERPETALADAGYWSEANVTACSRPDGPELLIATTKDWKQRKLLREQGCPRGRIPQGLSSKERMERKLLTKRGRRLYRLRSVLVEPVYGQVKEGQDFRRFMRRGFSAAYGEAALVATSHNLLKLWRSGQSPWGWAKARLN
ncbi:MAG: IS1182 family transposase [Dehalococcoidia bacterium]|nr:IS1182 family transposase [Dehalococcoidia bacterium]